MDGLAVDQAAVLAAVHEEVIEQPALGREQSAEADLPRRQVFDVLGDQTLQEIAPVGAVESDDGAAAQLGERL